MVPLLLALPWLALLAFLLFVVRWPTELAEVEVRAEGEGRVPFVSVIVPARDEAANIARCVRSLARSSYPAFEVLVIDDRSSDGTGHVARAIPRGNARRIRVLDGQELPPGWLGKPWACWQGARAAAGDVLLFTDADTVHGPALLGKALSALQEEGADLLTVVGRQLMVTFWEKIVQPQVFLTMLVRFPRFEALARTPRWRDAIANGQFLLFRRDSYEAIGGHEGVRDEVVEDLALAQAVKRSGLRLRIRSAEQDLATRMYRSLPQLVEGWSKNIVTGGLQTFPPALRRLVPPVSLAGGVGLWLVPPVVLALAVAGLAGPAWLAWSASACLYSVAVWAYFSARMGTGPAYGILYPMGALVGTYIFLRSWMGGRNVTWKGRRYELPPLSERA